MTSNSRKDIEADLTAALAKYKTVLSPEVSSLIAKLYLSSSNECADAWRPGDMFVKRTCFPSKVVDELYAKYVNGTAKTKCDKLAELMLKYNCGTESCIARHTEPKSLMSFFKPQVEDWAGGMASSVFITNFFTQMEHAYPEFHSLGINFSDVNKYDNTLSKFKTVPGKRYYASILNTCERDAKRGIHWHLIFIDLGNTIELFDSYGRNYPYLERIAQKIKDEHKGEIVYVGSPDLQKNNIYCGFYCCQYILLRLAGADHSVLHHPILWNDLLIAKSLPNITAKDKESKYIATCAL